MERKKRLPVVSGSVWETRMINDEIMGGFKLHNEKNPEESNNSSERKLKTPVVRRKTWKNDNLVEIAVKKSVNLKSKSYDFEEVKKQSIVKNGDGIQKGLAKSGEISNVFDESKNEQKKAFFGSKNEFIEEIEKNSVEIVKISNGVEKGLAKFIKSDNLFEESKVVSKKGLNEQKKANFSGLLEIEKNSVEIVKNSDEIEKGLATFGENGDLFEKSKMVAKKVLNEPKKAISSEIGKNSDEIEKGLARFEDSSNFFEEPKKVLNEQKRAKSDEIEKNGSDLSENGNKLSNVENIFEEKSEGKNIFVEEIREQKSKEIVVINEVKKISLKKEVKKQSPSLVHCTRSGTSTAKTKAIPDFDRFESQSNHSRIHHNHGKLQSLIDLVMWKDASRSTFIFGIGTFIIISSSYTNDLNISLISIFAYLGLAYLATIFIFRSIILRGVIDTNDTSEEYVIGEEEAMWLLKMILPYLNECLVKIKALFSGDPATTMKLAVLLYILARCGSSITIWKMAKLGFFGIFTVPKICSLYSTHLTAYGKFWIRRFVDAWDSCSHKKAVGFGIFTFFWNFSSVVARIWAVFMLLVAFKYYQQSVVTNDDYVEQDDEQKCEISLQGHVGGRRLRQHGPIHVVTSTTRKEKKRF